MSLLRGLGSLTPVVAGMVLLVVSAGEGYAQDGGGVAGRVLSTIGSQAGEPVPGVTIRLPGLRLETETDDEGRFAFLAVPAGRYEIRAEILGCQLGSRTLVVREDEVVDVDLSMSQPVIAIPGMEVRGLGTEPPDFELPYSVGRLDPTKLERHPGRTIADLLRGEFPGVKIMQGSGLAGSEISIQLRGRRSISTRQEPLVVLDGVITGGGTIDINPRDVEDIVVLKGAAASAQYGSRGQAGVIEITTRQGGTRTTTRREPRVIVDGVVSSNGLDEIDPTEIESMELVGGAVARLLFGRGAPEAGLVRITTRGGVSANPLHSCFEPSGASG
jgi:TonB-dependent SusC/RagA subfamily outer membrane receptor